MLLTLTVVGRQLLTAPIARAAPSRPLARTSLRSQAAVVAPLHGTRCVLTVDRPPTALTFWTTSSIAPRVQRSHRRPTHAPAPLTRTPPIRPLRPPLLQPLPHLLQPLADPLAPPLHPLLDALAHVVASRSIRLRLRVAAFDQRATAGRGAAFASLGRNGHREAGNHHTQQQSSHWLHLGFWLPLQRIPAPGSHCRSRAPTPSEPQPRSQRGHTRRGPHPTLRPQQPEGLMQVDVRPRVRGRARPPLGPELARERAYHASSGRFARRGVCRQSRALCRGEPPSTSSAR